MLRLGPEFSDSFGKFGLETLALTVGTRPHDTEDTVVDGHLATDFDPVRNGNATLEAEGLGRLTVFSQKRKRAQAGDLAREFVSPGGGEHEPQQQE